MSSSSPSKFPYATADYERIKCSLCGRNETDVLCRRDRNGLNVQSCICKYCGLIYINPRMTARWYGQYYDKEYRAQVARFKGKPNIATDHASAFRAGVKHGTGLARAFKNLWLPGLTLEVGSSLGGVLEGIRQELSVPVLGIEPSPDESGYANEHGVKTFTALIESFSEPIEQASNILCTQSLNHLLDPRYFLTWSHGKLRDGGMLILEVLNFRHLLRRYHYMPRAVQIDHTYMFVPEVLSNFVEAAGFEVMHLDTDEQKSREQLRKERSNGLPQTHIRLLARKLAIQPFSDPTRVKNQYAEIRGSIDATPQSSVKYFFKHGFKNSSRRIRAGFRGTS